MFSIPASHLFSFFHVEPKVPWAVLHPIRDSQQVWGRELSLFAKRGDFRAAIFSYPMAIIYFNVSL